MSKQFTRRTFLSTSAVAPMAISLASQSSPPKPVAANPGKGAWVRWLDEAASPVAQGVTWGTPWPRGKHKGSVNHFALRGADQKLHALHSWPLAYWPDGSLKFSAHALAPTAAIGNGPFEVVAPRGHDGGMRSPLGRQFQLRERLFAAEDHPFGGEALVVTGVGPLARREAGRAPECVARSAGNLPSKALALETSHARWQGRARPRRLPNIGTLPG